MKNNNYTSFFKTKPKKIERYIRCRKCGGNIADMVIENILHRKSYRKISKERYIPMNPKDFYGYRRKTVAVLYERMRLLGINVALAKTVYVETLSYSELNVTDTKKDAR